MKDFTLAKAAIASLLVATTMAGCAGAAFHSRAAASPQEDMSKLAESVEKALATRDSARAVIAAEAAVKAAPEDPRFRHLLGRAYMQSGRFISAETAFNDAMTLGDSGVRTILSLALVQTALGKGDEARSLLAAHSDSVPAGDYGLAMAMAGDTAEGVRVLLGAVRDPSATARTRQNLAYAYALAGQWKEARAVVGQDLDPETANRRMIEWAALAGPGFASQRAAALMGVTLNKSDLGQPETLALAQAAAQPTDRTASVMTADGSTSMSTDVPPEIADSRDRVERIVMGPRREVVQQIATAPAKPAPLIRAKSSPARVAVRDIAGEGSKAPQAQMQKVAFMTPVADGASNWVVQLGAYDSAAVAKDKWMDMARGNAMLARFPLYSSQAKVNGKVYHRVALSGFASWRDAAALCRSIKARKGRCFVREVAPDATPQRWAVNGKGRRYAAR